MRFMDSDNVETYSVFINDDYYGDDINEIQVNNGDVIKIIIDKKIGGQPSSIVFNEELL
jgi:hypothetical protein